MFITRAAAVIFLFLLCSHVTMETEPLELLIQFESSNKLLKWNRTSSLTTCVKSLFGILPETDIILQEHHKKYGMYVDVTDYETLEHESVLKCIVKPGIAASNVMEQDMEPESSGRTEAATRPTSAPTVKKPWPKYFNFSEIFSENLHLSIASVTPNQVLRWQIKHELLCRLSDEIVQYTLYPTKMQIQGVARDLITKYPNLRDPLGSGIDSWSQCIRDRMKNVRRVLDDPLVNCRKRKVPALGMNEENEDGRSELTTPKKFVPKKGEIHWSPKMPQGEDEVSSKRHIENMKKLVSQSGKIHNKEQLKAAMDATFPFRRQLINTQADLQEIKDQYPGLFTTQEIGNEFFRLMQFDLKKQFEDGLKKVAPSIVKLAEGKMASKANSSCKAIGETLEGLRPYKDEDQTTYENHMRMAAVLLLPQLLGEKTDKLVRIYPVSCYLIYGYLTVCIS